jgi:hypothetical protein
MTAELSVVDLPMEWLEIDNGHQLVPTLTDMSSDVPSGDIPILLQKVQEGMPANIHTCISQFLQFLQRQRMWYCSKRLYAKGGAHA